MVPSSTPAKYACSKSERRPSSSALRCLSCSLRICSVTSANVSGHVSIFASSNDRLMKGCPLMWAKHSGALTCSRISENTLNAASLSGSKKQRSMSRLSGLSDQRARKNRVAFARASSSSFIKGVLSTKKYYCTSSSNDEALMGGRWFVALAPPAGVVGAFANVRRLGRARGDEPCPSGHYRADDAPRSAKSRNLPPGDPPLFCNLLGCVKAHIASCCKAMRKCMSITGNPKNEHSPLFANS